MKCALSILAILTASLAPLYLRRGRSKAPLPAPLALLLLLASFLEAFDLLCSLDPQRLELWKRWAVNLEAWLAPVCCWFSLTHARSYQRRALPFSQKTLMALSLLFALATPFLPVGALFYSPDFASDAVLFLNGPGLIF
jgi:hypothetical protein